MGVALAALFVVSFSVAFSGTAIADRPTDRQADRLKVAVIPGIAINLDTSRVDAISQDLAESLSAELDVEVIGGLEVRRQLPPDGLPDECAVEPKCAADAAARLGVQQLLFIVLVNTGAAGSIQMDTTWVAPGLGTGLSAGQRVTRPAIDFASIESAKERFAASARKLLPDAPVRRKPSTISTPMPRFDEGKPRHFTALSLATAGITVAALGTGIGFGLSTRSRYQDCDKPPYCTDGEKKSVRARGVIADAGFVVALAGAITTAILYSTSAEVPRMMVAPTDDGVAVTGMLRF
jgi:hypothetical protein